MLKVWMFIECDSCNEQFYFARGSTTDSNWHHNALVLTQMVRQYDWVVQGKEHFCLECWGEICEMEALQEAQGK